MHGVAPGSYVGLKPVKLGEARWRHGDRERVPVRMRISANLLTYRNLY